MRKFLIFVYLLITNIFKKETSHLQSITSNQSSPKTTSIQTKIEGELIFINKETKKPIKKIDIEIAETYLERQQGLMYRTSLPDSIGMLFIFERPELRSFWMKDTYISLDILYVNENMEIVTIQRYTKPNSEESIQSYKYAQYVVEVIAGFCDKYGVKEGDIIQFESL